MFQRETSKIIKNISLNNYIEVVRVEEVIKSQFKFVRDTIISAEKNKKDTFKIVMLPKFCKFVPNKEQIQYIINSVNLKNENNLKKDVQGTEA